MRRMALTFADKLESCKWGEVWHSLLPQITGLITSTNLASLSLLRCLMASVIANLPVDLCALSWGGHFSVLPGFPTSPYFSRQWHCASLHCPRCMTLFFSVVSLPLSLHVILHIILFNRPVVLNYGFCLLFTCYVAQFPSNGDPVSY